MFLAVLARIHVNVLAASLRQDESDADTSSELPEQEHLPAEQVLGMIERLLMLNEHSAQNM